MSLDGATTLSPGGPASLTGSPDGIRLSTMGARISVLLADDNLIVREGVKALVTREEDLEVVGEAAEYDEVIACAERLRPDVVVTDIRMPPSLQREGIDAAREVRLLHPGTGVVILSQYAEPSYAISVLGADGVGWAYLLKDRIADGDQLARAIRSVAAGDSVLDPAIVAAVETPVAEDAVSLDESERQLLHLVARGRSLKAIAVARGTTAAGVAEDVDQLFLKLSKSASEGAAESLRLLRLLHEAIVEREELGEVLSRFLPGGVAEQLREHERGIGMSERLVVTVLMSDVRGYCGIAERTDPAQLASQLNEHRAEMSRAVLGSGGTVMQFAGDAVLAVFGAPTPQADHAERAVAGARSMQLLQTSLNECWQKKAWPAFGIGVGLSTGEVAAALLGSEQRVEYSIVGDTVNLAQRLQARAGPGEIVASDATVRAIDASARAIPLPPQPVKGRQSPVLAYRVG